jgi:hypothetical protein
LPIHCETVNVHEPMPWWWAVVLWIFYASFVVGIAIVWWQGRDPSLLPYNFGRASPKKKVRVRAVALPALPPITFESSIVR